MTPPPFPLQDVAMDSEATRQAVIDMCMVFHTTIRDEVADAFLREQGEGRPL